MWFIKKSLLSLALLSILISFSGLAQAQATSRAAQIRSVTSGNSYVVSFSAAKISDATRRLIPSVTDTNIDYYRNMVLNYAVQSLGSTESVRLSYSVKTTIYSNEVYAVKMPDGATPNLTTINALFPETLLFVTKITPAVLNAMNNISVIKPDNLRSPKTIVEYDAFGQVLSSLEVPTTAAKEELYDLKQINDGRIAIFTRIIDLNNPLYYSLKLYVYSPQTRSWSVTESDGGVFSGESLEVYQNYVFTNGGMGLKYVDGVPKIDYKGIARFNINTNTYEYFASDPKTSYQDISLYNGQVYALFLKRIDVFDASTLAFVKSINLSESVLNITIAQGGSIYASKFGQVYHFTSEGVLMKKMDLPLSHNARIGDIDMSPDGMLIVNESENKTPMAAIVNPELTSVFLVDIGQGAGYLAPALHQLYRPYCPGDLNNDDLVNSADLQKLWSEIGKSAFPRGYGSDIDANGRVDYSDYLAWQRKVGSDCQRLKRSHDYSINMLNMYVEWLQSQIKLAFDQGNISEVFKNIGEQI